MSWRKRFVGRNEDGALSPEATAVFEKIARFLADEDAQNERLPLSSLTIYLGAGAMMEALERAISRREAPSKGGSLGQIHTGIVAIADALSGPMITF